MPENCWYEAALTAALAVIHELAKRPGMSRPEQLSTVTFLILNSMRQVEEQRPVPAPAEGGGGLHWLEPSIN